MNKCDWCGEYTKVKKTFRGGFQGSHLTPFPIVITYDLVCEKCNKVNDIIIRKSEEECKKAKEKEQKEWIKKRDKLLGET